MPPKPRPIADRFWEKVDKSGDCWLWTGSKDSRGNYGTFNMDGMPRRAHRVAWLLAHGEWPQEDLVVCHSCDTPACVRIDHLFLATQAENLRDMYRKGRNYMTKNQIRGEQTPNARLTDDLVKGVLTDYAAGMRVAHIARRHGLDPSHCRQIVKRRIWRHVTI